MSCILAGELLGCLCKREGAAVYGSVEDIVLEGVRSTLERPPIIEAATTPQDADNLTEKLGSSPRARERVIYCNNEYIKQSFVTTLS